MSSDIVLNTKMHNIKISLDAETHKGVLAKISGGKVDDVVDSPLEIPCELVEFMSSVANKKPYFDFLVEYSEIQHPYGSGSVVRVSYRGALVGRVSMVAVTGPTGKIIGRRLRLSSSETQIHSKRGYFESVDLSRAVGIFNKYFKKPSTSKRAQDAASRISSVAYTRIRTTTMTKNENIKALLQSPEFVARVIALGDEALQRLGLDTELNRKRLKALTNTDHELRFLEGMKTRMEAGKGVFVLKEPGGWVTCRSNAPSSAAEPTGVLCEHLRRGVAVLRQSSSLTFIEGIGYKVGDNHFYVDAKEEDNDG